MISSPYVDARVFAEKIASNFHIKLIFGDNVLRVETIYRQERNEFLKFPASKMRITGSAEVSLISMKTVYVSLSIVVIWRRASKVVRPNPMPLS